ncbi:MAG: family 78 glycoside hydrolase catalytic domain [Pirellulales bacterium]|nr:family 78 glycoside hydrolase catalytic domain [Pirellulales bacterium]
MPIEKESLHVAALCCEYLEDPLGIDVARPRLSWRIEPGDPAERGLRQTAYQVLVAGTPDALEADRGDLWDSGRVESDQSMLVEYGGKPLASRTFCFWKVRVWDQNGRASAWSRSGRWSMGLLTPADWKARWIGAAPKPGQPPADPWFRKTFSLAGRPDRATAYVASLGYHELYVNGRKVGDRVLEPSVSDLSQRVRYLTYDVTDYLREGKNAVVLWCAAGWANFNEYKVPDKPLAKAQIEIQPSDGPPIQIVTDATWKTHPSPLAPIGGWGFWDFGGERYDAAAEIPGWNAPDFDDSSWPTAALFTSKVRLSAEMIQPNRRLKILKPVEIAPQGAGVFRIDMGQSYTGWIEIRMKGRPGGKATLQFSERPEEPETYHQRSEYVFDGSGEGVFRQRFNYAAFRWVTVAGLEAAPGKEDIRGWLISTAVPRVGRFACSNDLLNRIYETTVWTFRCLSLGGYMVDCPHRERMGYGGDAFATMETALTNFGMGAFYTKWLTDWRDLQRPNGDLPYTAPTYFGGGGPAWSGICVALPWQVYLHYGDRRILDVSYPSMQRWIAFLQTKTKDHLLQKWGGEWDFLGDWVPPGKGQALTERVDERSTLFFNNCFYLDNLTTVAQTAELLGKPDEAAAYRQEAQAIARAVHKEFFHPADNSYANGDQLYQAMPLLMGVTPDSLQPTVMKRLTEEITVKKKGHIDTGTHGTYYLIKLLVGRNRNDLIFRMADQRTYPSWGYMLDQGATTLWEQWDGKNSRLHSTFVSIGSWFIEGLAGIRLDPARPGYKHFLIRPGIVGDLQWAKGEYDSPYGKIVSDWKISNGRLALRVEVPPNSSATVFVPADDPSSVAESGRPAAQSPGVRFIGMTDGTAAYEVGSGRYTFSAPR